MTDLSGLSDAQLQAIAGGSSGAPAAAPDLSVMSDADLSRIAGQGGVLSNSPDDGWLSSAAKAIPTAARNAGNMIVGRFGDVANFGDYLAARLTSAVSGRSMDEVRDRAAKAQAAGSAESPLGWAGAHLTGQKLVPSSQTFADLENPYTGEYQPTSEPGRMAMTAAEMALSGPGGAAKGPATLAGQVAARKAMALGLAASGAVSQGVTDATDSPIAGLVAGAVVPGASAKLADAGKSLLATSSKRPGMVADKLNAAAENPDKFRADLNANPDEIIPGAKLTTGQQTGDLGILNAERQARTRDEGFGQQFKHREEQQNIAHGDALDAQAPEAADKLAPSQLFQQHLDDLDQQTQQTVDRMTAGRDLLHDQIPDAQPPEQVGGAIRTPMQATEQASKEIHRELYRRVDPDGTFHVSTDPIHEGAAQIRAGVGPLGEPLSPLEQRIHAQIDQGAAGPTVPFNAAMELEQNINAALRETPHGTPANARLQQLKTIVRGARNEAMDSRHAAEQSAVGRGTMDPAQTMEARLRAQWGLDDSVDGRVAQGAGSGSGLLPRGNPPAEAGTVGAANEAAGRSAAPAGNSGVPQATGPEITTEPADRLNVANQSYAAHKQTFGTGAAGKILTPQGRPGYTPDSGVPATAFAKGDRGYDAARSVVEASNNHPDVIQGLQDAAVNRLQADMAKNNGQLTPKMLAKWKTDHAQALRGIDEVAPGFSRQFDNAAAAQDLVDRATAGREAALKAYNNSEAGKLVGKTSEQEVENHLGNILGDGGKGASRMQQLVTAARGNLAALDGLKRATVDWMLRKKANNAEVGTSGAKALSSAGVQGLVKNSEAQLRTLFGDAGYANLQKVAESMAAKDRSTTATNIAGSPNTARDMGHMLEHAGSGNHETAMALIASHIAEHGIGHGLKLAAGAVPLLVLKALRSRGMHSVEEMYKDALLNPDRARFYLSQAGSKTSPVWHSLARSLGAAPSQANADDHNRMPESNAPHVANFAEGGAVSWSATLPPAAGGRAPPPRKTAPPPAYRLEDLTPESMLATVRNHPNGPVAPPVDTITELLQQIGVQPDHPAQRQRFYVAPGQRLSSNIENREGEGYFNPIGLPVDSFNGVPRNGSPPVLGSTKEWNQILPANKFTPMQGPIDHYAEGGAVSDRPFEPSYTDPMGNVAYADSAPRVDPNQNVPDGPTMKAYEPSITERVAQWMMGNDRASPERARFVGGLMGTTGLNPKGMGVIDAVPGLGQLANFEGAAHEGDYKQAAIGLIPGAAPLMGEVKAGARALANVAHSATPEGQTGARYVTRQDGPFYRVEKAPVSEGIGSVDRGPEEALGGGAVRPTDAGTAGRARDADAQLPPQAAAQSPVVDPRAVASDYMQKVHGTDLVEPQFSSFDPNKMLTSSLTKQSAIGRAHMLAVEGSPAYKEAVFKAYQQQHPEMVAQSGATNYDELLQASYRQMAHETADQFEHLPLKFSFHRNGEGDYPHSKAMVQNVRDNGHLHVFQGGDEHDFLNQIDPHTGLNENEKFRAVHDAFGHAAFGNPFGAQGEEKAWATHQQMYSPLARPAMSAETRGQNSVVNYTPLNADLRANAADLERAAMTAKRVGDTEGYEAALAGKAKLMKEKWQYAPQKAVLLPPEMIDPNYRGGMPDYVQKLIKPERGTAMSSRLTHFSNEPGIDRLDPGMYGTGIKGDEASRLKSSGAIKDRSYYYLGDHRDVTPEEGLGEHAYTTTSHGLYDLTKDPLNFKTLSRESNREPWLGNFNPGTIDQNRAMNDMERLAKEYGYEGVANPNAAFPMAAVFKPKPVTWQGSTRQTVDLPQRMAYSGIYDNPRALAQEAESRVAPESPNLKRLFGVTRDDLYQMGGNRAGNMEPQLPLNPSAKIPEPVQRVMTPRNAGRMMDALDEFSRQTGLRKGMMSWYTMDPAYQRLVQLVGPEEAGRRFAKLSTMTSMASPGSEVTTEMNRGLAAHWLENQGRFGDFERFGGLPDNKRGKNFPPDMSRIIGHPYHSTSHVGPMSRYLQSGDVNMSSAKVPLYMQASSVPELGFQTSLPVPDAHFTRGTGLSDTRTAQDFGASMKMREYNHFGPWFRDQVATPLEMQSVPAQALMWGGYSRPTGVETSIGAPKLELLADHIAKSAFHHHMSPEAARDHILLGKGFARGGLAQAMGL